MFYKAKVMRAGNASKPSTSSISALRVDQNMPKNAFLDSVCTKSYQWALDMVAPPSQTLTSRQNEAEFWIGSKSVPEPCPQLLFPIFRPVVRREASLLPKCSVCLIAIGV